MIKRRKRPKDGDVFTIDIKEGLYSYGQVIDKEYNLYLIYDILGDENKSIEEVIKSPKMLLTRSFNYSFRDGDWKIVGNAQIPEDLNIPMFKMGVDSKYHVVNYKCQRLINIIILIQ
ncbi:immunity 26/phosphotriesterase HocA family protein [Romboutsia lituseburensis]|uniref:immunity 26/phosphotriesterase HocA family protein n=1 Tax=Romboutsia lituseburensis TaxID=1537 RepID=UPI00215AE9DD|nr:immunity 26/phosphotriesterase HocA family protein [Romboutsia lituseburensis]MCR8746826.1 immunity 26/phosphotriesterase HocA family protein [Romboutsia lituseburensis]